MPCREVQNRILLLRGIDLLVDALDRDATVVAGQFKPYLIIGRHAVEELIFTLKKKARAVSFDPVILV